MFAYLCKKFSLDPLADGVIISHSEGFARGIASKHSDVEHIWKEYDLSMTKFRQDVSAIVSNQLVRFNLLGKAVDIPGMIINDRSHVQARPLLEELGYKVDWDESTKTVIVKKYDVEHIWKEHDLSMTKFRQDVSALISGEFVRFNLLGKAVDIPGMIIDNRSHVQSRPLLEELGYKVDWDESTKTVIVKK